MNAGRDGSPTGHAESSSRTPARPRAVWVDPEGNVYDRGGGTPVPTGETLDELDATHDGLGSAVAVLATGWRLYHARPRDGGPP